MPNAINLVRLVDSSYANSRNNSKPNGKAGPRIKAWGGGDEKPIMPSTSGAGPNPGKPRDQPSIDGSKGESLSRGAHTGRGSDGADSVLAVRSEVPSQLQDAANGNRGGGKKKPVEPSEPVEDCDGNIDLAKSASNRLPQWVDQQIAKLQEECLPAGVGTGNSSASFASSSEQPEAVLQPLAEAPVPRNGSDEKPWMLGEHKEPPFYRGDHAELADRLLRRLWAQAQASVVFADGCLWQYCPATHVYRPATDSKLSQIVQGFAGAKLGKNVLTISSGAVSGAIRFVKERVDDAEFFAKAKPGIAFNNGYVEITAAGPVVHDHSPNNRARFAYPFEFDQSKEPAMWLKFLGQCFDGDKDAEAKIKYIQEFVGIAMLGQGPKYQLATVLLGKGSNGKGVLCQVVQASMPPGAVCAIPPQDFGQEYRRARIAGKLLNVVSELPEREILDCESIKAMISGDLLTGREIRQAPFDFCPMSAHLFACNRLPNSADHTPGFWRRFAVINFSRVFEGEAKNPNLADEIIAAELPTIVSWFLAGAQRVLMEGRYTIPDSAVEAVANWKKDADVVQRFFDECCHRLDPTDDIKKGTVSATLYKTFKAWALENGNRPMASNVFGARMAFLNLKAEHTKTGNYYPVTLG